MTDNQKNKTSEIDNKNHLLNLVFDPGFSSGELLLLLPHRSNTTRVPPVRFLPLSLLPLPLHLKPFLTLPLLLLRRVHLVDFELRISIRQHEVHRPRTQTPPENRAITVIKGIRAVEISEKNVPAQTEINDKESIERKQENEQGNLYRPWRNEGK